MISIKLIIFLCLFFAINGSSIVAREKVVGKSKNVKEDNWNKGQSFDKGAIESFSNDRQPETREVANCVFSFTSNGGIISLFMVTYEGVMVIDPFTEEHSKLMLEAIRNITDAPIVYLFYSHNHWDHNGGGQVFRDEGATIISHVDAYDFLKANPKEGVLLPDYNWIGDQYDITLGNIIVQMHYLGLSHGNGMTSFVLPNQKVGYLADVFKPKSVGYLFLPDFNPPGWMNTLMRFAEFDVDVIVASHNGNALDPLETGNKESLNKQLQFLQDLQAAVREELAMGTSISDIGNIVKLPQYEDLAGYETQFPLNVQAMAVNEVNGPSNWHQDRSVANERTL